MNNTWSNSTISTSASLNRGMSSKNMLFGFGSRNALFKANRNSKFNMMGAGGNSRWRAPERRDASLNNLTAKPKSSMTHLLNRLQATRVVSKQNLGNATFNNTAAPERTNENKNNAQFSEAPISEICFVKDKMVPAISIKSAALNRALHRDIMLKDNQKTEEQSEGRWSSKNIGEKNGSGLNQPRRQASVALLKKPTRKVSNYDLNR